MYDMEAVWGDSDAQLKCKQQQQQKNSKICDTVRNALPIYFILKIDEKTYANVAQL